MCSRSKAFTLYLSYIFKYSILKKSSLSSKNNTKDKKCMILSLIFLLIHKSWLFNAGILNNRTFKFPSSLRISKKKMGISYISCKELTSHQELMQKRAVRAQIRKNLLLYLWILGGKILEQCRVCITRNIKTKDRYMITTVEKGPRTAFFVNFLRPSSQESSIGDENIGRTEIGK